jgi:hypothetical protein
MAKRFSSAVIAGAALMGVGLYGMSAARAAVEIQWFQDPTASLPFGNPFSLFPAYTIGNAAASSSFISLDAANHAAENIAVASTGGTYTGGSPLANYTSTNAGNSPAPNTLTAFTFSPGPDPNPANRFVGVYIVGQIDSENGAGAETLTVDVNYLDVTTGIPGAQTHVFTVDAPDIGRVGFDEEPGSDVYDVTSASFSLTPGDAAWNNISVVNIAVPEPSTWAMMVLGFVGIAFAGYRSRRAISIV